jgi:hypothetical protein
MVSYDTMELSDLLLKLKEKQKNKSNDVFSGCFLYDILCRHSCSWDSILESYREFDLQNAFPTLFANFEDIPLMINRITDQEDYVILQWRLDLGK